MMLLVPSGIIPARVDALAMKAVKRSASSSVKSGSKNAHESEAAAVATPRSGNMSPAMQLDARLSATMKACEESDKSQQELISH